MNYLLISLLALTSINLKAISTCPLMIGEENDPEETITVEGNKLEFCCGSCVSKFEDNKAYYIAASKELFAQFSDTTREKLGVDKVVLLDQRRCPVYNDRLINPNSPSIEYQGKKIYFWSSSALRRWKRDPDSYYEKARASGVLK